MKKLLFFFIILSCAFLCFFYGLSTEKVLLVPLDSRPCNTEEMVLLGKAAKKTVSYPNDHLDSLERPGDPDALWAWLEEESKKNAKVILFSNSLLNGGLMASRQTDSYYNQAHFLDRLDRYLSDNPTKDITIVTVFPRVLPDGLDPELTAYTKALVAWGEACDQADIQHQPEPAAPNIPSDLQERYRSVYAQSAQVCRGISQLAQSHHNLTYYISLDDNAPNGFPRLYLRQLAPAHHAQILNGADEITALLLAQNSYQRPLSVAYSDPNGKDLIPAFEGQPLSQSLAEKSHFLFFSLEDRAENKILIHNKPGQGQALKSIWEESAQRNLALADVAQTNRGDKELLAPLENPPQKLTAYSGWNTSSNSLGTSLAALRIQADHGKNPLSRQALRRYYQVRLAIDQGYLAQLGPDLRKDWESRGLIQANGSFTSPNAKAQCTDELNIAYAKFQKTHPHFPKVSFYFPWSRTFEVGVQDL